MIQQVLSPDFQIEITVLYINPSQGLVLIDCMSSLEISKLAHQSSFSCFHILANCVHETRK